MANTQVISRSEHRGQGTKSTEHRALEGREYREYKAYTAEISGQRVNNTKTDCTGQMHMADQRCFGRQPFRETHGRSSTGLCIITRHSGEPRAKSTASIAHRV
jgi:hypothetical protein